MVISINILYSHDAAARKWHAIAHQQYDASWTGSSCSPFVAIASHCCYKLLTGNGFGYSRNERRADGKPHQEAALKRLKQYILRTRHRHRGEKPCGSGASDDDEIGYGTLVKESLVIEATTF